MTNFVEIYAPAFELLPTEKERVAFLKNIPHDYKIYK